MFQDTFGRSDAPAICLTSLTMAGLSLRVSKKVMPVMVTPCFVVYDLLCGLSGMLTCERRVNT